MSKNPTPDDIREPDELEPEQLDIIHELDGLIDADVEEFLDDYIDYFRDNPELLEDTPFSDEFIRQLIDSGNFEEYVDAGFIDLEKLQELIDDGILSEDLIDKLHDETDVFEDNPELLEEGSSQEEKNLEKYLDKVLFNNHDNRPIDEILADENYEEQDEHDYFLDNKEDMVDMQKLNLPPEVMATWQHLNQHGEAVLVGGIVRDLVVGKKGNDYDFATSLSPQQVKNSFNNTNYKVIPTGEQFGTVTIVPPGSKEKIEVTTYRSETYDGQSRKPMVTHGTTLQEDTGRRDLSINSLALDINGKIIDHHNGLQDMKNGVIRTVGNPHERFREDPLRVLRTARFSGRFNYKIDNQTKQAMSDMAQEAKRLSRERITDEMKKILTTPNPVPALQTLKQTGVLKELYPELDQLDKAKQTGNTHHKYNVWGHTIMALKNSPNDYITRLAVLYHDVGKPATESIDNKGVSHYFQHEKVGQDMWKNIAHRDKHSKDITNRVGKLIKDHLKPAHYDDRQKSGTIRKTIRNHADKDYNRLLAVSASDVSSHSDNTHINGIKTLKAYHQRVQTEKQDTPKQNILPSGFGKTVIQQFNLEPGPKIGAYLKHAENAILDRQISNDNPQEILNYLRDNPPK